MITIQARSTSNIYSNTALQSPKLENQQSPNHGNSHGRHVGNLLGRDEIKWLKVHSRQTRTLWSHKFIFSYKI